MIMILNHQQLLKNHGHLYDCNEGRSLRKPAKTNNIFSIKNQTVDMVIILNLTHKFPKESGQNWWPKYLNSKGSFLFFFFSFFFFVGWGLC